MIDEFDMIESADANGRKKRSKNKKELGSVTLEKLLFDTVTNMHEDNNKNLEKNNLNPLPRSHYENLMKDTYKILYNCIIILTMSLPMSLIITLQIFINDIAKRTGKKSYKICGHITKQGNLAKKIHCKICSLQTSIAHANRNYTNGILKTTILTPSDENIIQSAHNLALEKMPELNQILKKNGPIPLEFTHEYVSIVFPILSCTLSNYKEWLKMDATYIGCDERFYVFNMKRQLKEGWTLTKRKGIWDKDHIVPCAKVDLNTDEGIIQAFSWYNFQPLSSKENRSKGGR